MKTDPRPRLPVPLAILGSRRFSSRPEAIHAPSPTIPTPTAIVTQPIRSSTAARLRMVSNSRPNPPNTAMNPAVRVSPTTRPRSAAFSRLESRSGPPAPMK